MSGLVQLAIVLFQVCAFSNPFLPVWSAEKLDPLNSSASSIDRARTIDEGLLDLLARGHHERTVLEHSLVQRLASDLETKQNQIGRRT